MRAVVIARPGPPDGLEFRDVAIPQPRAGEVRVRVRAFGINRADLLQRRGLYPAPPDSPQDIPGLEFAGEVDAVAADVSSWRKGERVMSISGGGSYAEFITIPAGHLLRIPDGMAYEDAAAIPEAFLTAFDALEQLKVVSNEWVLVHAVGSGVGTAAVQLIRARGSNCIGTSRTADKLARAEQLGMNAGIDTSSGDVVAAVKAIAKQGVDAVVDLVSGAGFTTTLKSMAPRGRLIIVGLTGGNKAEVDLGIILRNRLQITGTVLRSRSNAEKAELVTNFAAKALNEFAEGKAVPVVDRVFPFDETVASHVYMETNANFGKVIVSIP